MIELRGGGQRTFGQTPKTIPTLLQPPELDTDSIMTEKNNPTQEKKSEEQQAHPTINIAEYAQEMTTEQIHAQRLPMEPVTAPLLNNEIPWMDYDWAQNDWGRTIIVGACQ